MEDIVFLPVDECDLQQENMMCETQIVIPELDN